MKRFSELQAKQTESDKKQFDCERIKITELVNTSVVVVDFEGGVKTEFSDNAYVVLVSVGGINKKFFTTSPFMICALDSVGRDNFPFETTIKSINCGSNKVSYKFT